MILQGVQQGQCYHRENNNDICRSSPDAINIFKKSWKYFIDKMCVCQHIINLFIGINKLIL